MWMFGRRRRRAIVQGQVAQVVSFFDRQAVGRHRVGRGDETECCVAARVGLAPPRSSRFRCRLGPVDGDFILDRACVVGNPGVGVKIKAIGCDDRLVKPLPAGTEGGSRRWRCLDDGGAWRLQNEEPNNSGR